MRRLARLTTPQRELLGWLRLAGPYRRWCYGGELRTARSLRKRRLCRLERNDGDWFAEITQKGMAAT